MTKQLHIPITKFTIDDSFVDDRFIKVKFFGISEGLNVNNSNFTIKSMVDAIPTVKKSMILACLSFDQQDVTEHTSKLRYDPEAEEYYYDYQNGERIIGSVYENDPIEIEEIDGKKWLTYIGYISKEYNYQLQKILKKRRDLIKKVSVEVTVLDSYIDDQGVEIINKFVMLGTTLLGDAVAEGIPGAHLEILNFSKENVNKFRQQLSFALQQNNSTSLSPTSNSQQNFVWNGDVLQQVITKDNIQDILMGNNVILLPITNEPNKNILQEGGENKEVFEQLGMNELVRAIDKILNQYTWDDNDWNRNKYWIDDIKGNNVILYDTEEESYVIVPYLINEHNEVILDFDNAQEAEIEYVPKQTFAQNVLFISKDKLGSKDSITIDKSKDSMSETAWGDVDKSQLKKDCFMAKNWKAVCKAVFLELKDGWLDGKEGSLGFPVMQKSGDKVIYNRYGLASAKAYAEKNDDSAVLAKVNAIYKKLGLDKDTNSKKEDKKLSKEIKTKFTKNGFVCFSCNENSAFLFKNNKIYTVNMDATDPDDTNEIDMSAMENDEVVTLAQDAMGSMGEMMGDMAKMSEDIESMNAKVVEAQEKQEMAEKEKTEMEAEKEQMAKEKEELSAQKEELAKEKEEMAKKLQEKDDEIKMAKKLEAESVFAKEESKMDEEYKTKVKEKMDKMEYADMSEFKKDIAYAIYLKSEKEANDKNEFSYGVGSGVTPSKEVKSIFEELSEELNK